MIFDGKADRLATGEPVVAGHVKVKEIAGRAVAIEAREIASGKIIPSVMLNDRWYDS